jgi:hypothetical protein
MQQYTVGQNMNLHASIRFGTRIETRIEIRIETHTQRPTHLPVKNSHTDTLTHAHQNREARHRFALLKIANRVTRQSAALLHTIIPKNVLAKLGTLEAGECLNTEISQGTIMFCKLITPGGGAAGGGGGGGGGGGRKRQRAVVRTKKDSGNAQENSAAGGAGEGGGRMVGGRGGTNTRAFDYGLICPWTPTIDRAGNRTKGLVQGVGACEPPAFFAHMRSAVAPGCAGCKTINRAGNFVSGHDDGNGENWEGEGGAEEEEEGWEWVEEGGGGVNLEGFERVSRLVAELDDLVDAHNMTKYQHVNQWYIVVCPAIVKPFAGEGRSPKGLQSGEDEVCEVIAGLVYVYFRSLSTLMHTAYRIPHTSGWR